MVSGRNINGADAIVRMDELSRILPVLKRAHPHISGQTFARRIVERQRMEHALRMEAARLSYSLVARTSADGAPRCGVLVATPRPEAGDAFANYGRAPMFFGFLFGFESEADFRSVFEDVIALAAETGRTGIFGPVEATINYSIGLAEAPSPFPASLLMPENPAEWNAWLERCGFRVAQRLFTYEIDYARIRFSRFGERITELSSLRLETMAPPFTDAQRQAIVEVFNSGWADNWGFVKIGTEDVRSLEQEFRPLLWDGLTCIAWMNGKPAAISVSVPDVNEIARATGVPGMLARAWRMLIRRKAGTLKILILGVAREIHGTGLGIAVIERILDTGRAVAERHGVTRPHLGWVLESNRAVNHLIASWAPDARKAVHLVYRYDLAETPAAETACESHET